MPRLFVGNFDFEHELAGVSRPRASALNHDLSAVWLAIAEPGDAIEGFRNADPEFSSELRRAGRVLPAAIADEMDLVPWGWSPSVTFPRRDRNRPIRAPEESAVAAANSRRLSHRFEQDAGCALAGSAEVTDVAQFNDAVDQLCSTGDEWIAKAEFSMAGRETVRGRGSPSDSHRDWAGARLRETGVVFVEPRVKIVAEAGFQFDITEDGTVTHVGTTEVLAFPNGQFAGCLIESQPPGVLAPAFATIHSAAERVAACGYFGPLGIDAAAYRTPEGITLRPVQDMNARYTMGRLALGWNDRRDADSSLAWLFVPWTTHGAPRQMFAAIQHAASDLVDVVRTSPFELNDQPVRTGTVLLTAGSGSNLRAAVARVFDVVRRRA